MKFAFYLVVILSNQKPEPESESKIRNPNPKSDSESGIRISDPIKSGIRWKRGSGTSLNEGLQNKLQHIQNAAARLVTDTRKYDHVTPVLRDLHWLPIHQRIVFKLTNMVYKCQHGLCPSYLAEDCILVVGSTCDRLADWSCLSQEHELWHLVHRLFQWLPSALREPTLSFNCFQRGLKTFLFR